MPEAKIDSTTSPCTGPWVRIFLSVLQVDVLEPFGKGLGYFEREFSILENLLLSADGMEMTKEANPSRPQSQPKDQEERLPFFPHS